MTKLELYIARTLVVGLGVLAVACLIQIGRTEAWMPNANEQVNFLFGTGIVSLTIATFILINAERKYRQR